MYTTNTKTGLWAARRISAPEVVTSTFVLGMANRLVSIGGSGGGCGLEVGRMEWKTRVQTQALGKSWAGLAEDDGASNPEMGGFSS